MANNIPLEFGQNLQKASTNLLQQQSGFDIDPTKKFGQYFWTQMWPEMSNEQKKILTYKPKEIKQTVGGGDPDWEITYKLNKVADDWLRTMKRGNLFGGDYSRVFSAQDVVNAIQSELGYNPKDEVVYRNFMENFQPEVKGRGMQLAPNWDILNQVNKYMDEKPEASALDALEYVTAKNERKAGEVSWAATETIINRNFRDLQPNARGQVRPNIPENIRQSFDAIGNIKENIQQQIAQTPGDTITIGGIDYPKTELEFGGNLDKAIQKAQETGDLSINGEPITVGGTTVQQDEISEIDRLWTEWTDIQKAIANDPSMLDSLLDDITYFDDYYKQAKEDLAQQDLFLRNAIERQYDQQIEDINQNLTFTEQDKADKIQQLTNDYIDTHTALNFNQESAYRSATNSLKKAATEAGNAAASSYLNQVTAGVTGGNIGELRANQIMNALKEQKRAVGEQFQEQQIEIDLKRRSAIRQLESQVGSEEAKNIVDMAQELDPSLSPDTLNAAIDRRQQMFTGIDQARFKGLKFPGGQYEFAKEGQPDYVTGGLQRGMQQTQAQADLKKKQLERTRLAAKQEQAFKRGVSERELGEEEKAYKLQYIQPRLQYFPYLKKGEGEYEFMTDSQRTGGAKSFEEQNTYKYRLPFELESSYGQLPSRYTSTYRTS